MKAFKISHDYLALFVAVLVLFLTIWEGYETRQHNRISVVPKLDSDISIQSSSKRKSISYFVESTGLGPVKVVDFWVLYNNKGKITQSKNLDHLMTNLQILNEEHQVDLDIASSDLEIGSFIAPGDREVLFSANAESEKSTTDAFNDHVRNNLSIVVCYCSVYDDQCAKAQIGSSINDELVCKAN